MSNTSIFSSFLTKTAIRTTQKFLGFLRRRDTLVHYKWPGATIAQGAIIEGDPNKITLGFGTLVEPGALLSVKNGGRIVLGRECVIMRGAMIMTYGGDIELGDYCSVNPYTILYGHGGLKIGDYVRFAAHSVIIPANHGFDSLDTPIHKQPLTQKGISIGNDVWIGAQVTILDGTYIGDGAVIGAGSVVTKDITPFSVNVGNPARMIKSRIQTKTKTHDTQNY